MNLKLRLKRALRQQTGTSRPTPWKPCSHACQAQHPGKALALLRQRLDILISACPEPWRWYAATPAYG